MNAKTINITQIILLILKTINYNTNNKTIYISY